MGAFTRHTIRFGAGCALVLISTLGIPAIAEQEKGPAKPVEQKQEIPVPNREFRGVWISSVFNLDWPSEPGLPVETQKEELITILDNASDLKLNAVVLQVRTMCDALYDSPIEPWSYWLTGEMGKAPEPYYDPLAFAVKEAHARGLELHAWINPFRSMTSIKGTPVPKFHITKLFPDITQQSGHIEVLDPSDDFVRGRVMNIATDLVQRYDIDGLHLDDYFYPYPTGGAYKSSINDDKNWNKYVKEGGELNRDDWRRENINTFVRDLYRAVKRSNPACKVGISPSGIWQQNHPESIVGLSSFHQIYVDSRKWLREGWMDYMSPQLYWKIESRQSFTKLYNWWQEQNVHGRHVWPGIFASGISGPSADGRSAWEVITQIEHTRKNQFKSPATGHIHWHWDAFANNRGGLNTTITNKRYTSLALTPDSPWLAGQGAMGDDDEVEPVSGLKITRPSCKGKSMRVSWNLFANPDELRWICVQSRSGKYWKINRVMPVHSRFFELPSDKYIDEIAVRVVSKIGEVSEPATLPIKPPRPGQKGKS